ncbi:3-deoxy-D-manno-octulosonic acid kinase [Halomonas sp. WWR20]
MRLATFQKRKTFILYDAHILCDAPVAPQIDADWFTPAFWQARNAVTGQAPGRGSSLFVRAGHEQWVLRPYRRGGLIARLSASRYVWSGLERTRAFREMRLTRTLYDQGLPVPRPVGACVWRQGPVYEAALLTQRLAGAATLADHLAQADAALLARVGATIRRFHDAGLDHVDLNARNLLVTPDGRVWLIDLDRCRLRPPGAWQQANLQRLGRSLERFAPDRGERLLHLINHGYHSHPGLADPS